MAVIVSFIRPGGLGSVHAVGIGACRVRETLALNGTTTAALEDGEIAVLCSTETTTVLGAFGVTPDAAAAASTAVTSAGFPLPVGMIVPVAGLAGSKINVKAMA